MACFGYSNKLTILQSSSGKGEYWRGFRWVQMNGGMLREQNGWVTSLSRSSVVFVYLLNTYFVSTNRNWHWHDLECDNIAQAARLDGKTQRRRLEEETPDEWDEDHDGNSWDGVEEGEVNGENDEVRPSQKHRSPRAEKPGRQRPKHVFPHYHPESTIVSDADGFGWAHRYAMLYILYLAGEDAAARYEMGLMGTNEENILEQLEKQAANNLKQSFAVVGLLHETDTYFDMLSARVQYLDMSLHPDIEGELHETGANGYMARCKKTFSDPIFQEKLKEASPAVAALERLYKVAVEVNRQQVRELAASPNVDSVVRERLQKAANQF